MSTWNILYRGSLSSCNYDCSYCPFAKTSNTYLQLRQDEQELERFASWVAMQRQTIGILITPWGEALVRDYYRRAMTALSHLPNVYRITVQTNLSAPIDDFAAANRNSLALWATFHPSQVTLARFLVRCHELDEAGIRYSVGVVGIAEYFDIIEELRAALSPEIYLWINAYKRHPDYYHRNQIERLQAIDPYFHLNLRAYGSYGKPCATGETAFTVDGHGNVRRCHFIDSIIGNIYEPNFPACLKPRLCSAATCGCHIGYIHRQELSLGTLFGNGLLERIPLEWPQVVQPFTQSLIGGRQGSGDRGPG